jgi:hypothetical protein
MFFWGMIFLFLSFDIYSKDPITNPFPLRIAVPAVKMYVDTKPDLSMQELRQEYVYILRFLKEAITEYKKNIFIFLKEHSFKQRHLVFVNNKLGFIEEELITDKWSDITKQYIRVADINAGVEVICLGMAFETYNHFIDHWFSMTGETLDTKYDVNKEADELATMVNDYDNLGFYFFDAYKKEDND